VRDQEGDFTLLANEGELRIGTKDGLIYYLLFGEISATEDADKDSDAETKEGNDRFMAVFVEYRPEQDENIPAPVLPENSATPTTPSEEEGAAAVAPESPKVPTNLAEMKKAQEEGTERARKEQMRFQRFFYVISDADFKKLRPAASELFEQAAASFPTE
tara:strand:+ start:94 stop:573 length:480 start_codon:yes stop_codon:yes gene_type:complete